ncbi:MAG: hypothetical protein U9Q82_02495 [Chloroflexota bacterium]|nr:hypothetical protein [Chloroflexota bacterium]
MNFATQISISELSKWGCGARLPTSNMGNSGCIQNNRSAQGGGVGKWKKRKNAKTVAWSTPYVPQSTWNVPDHIKPAPDYDRLVALDAFHKVALMGVVWLDNGTIKEAAYDPNVPIYFDASVYTRLREPARIITNGELFYIAQNEEVFMRFEKLPEILRQAVAALASEFEFEALECGSTSKVQKYDPNTNMIDWFEAIRDQIKEIERHKRKAQKRDQTYTSDIDWYEKIAKIDDFTKSVNKRQ